MRKLYRFAICLLFTLLIGNPVWAQSPPVLWGLTQNGGDGLGTLFSINTGSTAISTQYNFQGYPGSAPQFVKLCQASSGKLYGTTRFGGTSNLGTLFEFNPATNSYSVLVDFDGALKGSDPQSSVIQATNGKLYGMTRLGGTNNVGVIFEYDPATSSFTKKYDMIAANGSFPQGSLIEASNGKLYGVNRFGGANGAGTLFEYNLSLSSYSVLISFSTAIGANPQAPPIQAANGKIYGTTLSGGSGNGGVIYEYDLSSSTYSVVFNYTAASTGNQPVGGIVQASNGKIYGTTNQGGANNVGVLFEFNPAGNTYSVLSTMASTLGANPQAALIQASNGKLYGTTRIGGANNLGTLFEFDPATNIQTKLLDFSAANGSNPIGAVTQATNGLLYGLTSAGGTQSVGVLYEYNISLNSYSKKIEFNTSSGGFPQGTLLHAANDKLYGLSSAGGTSTVGVIFEFDMSLNSYTKKIDLTAANGSQPSGGLIQAPNGKLYGMTRLGGASSLGTIFEYDYVLNAYTKKIDLTAANGSQPYGSLCLASNGKMYGLTNLGGLNSAGVLFEYDYVGNSYIKRVDFSTAIGSNPFGSLIQASNGKLYGLTRNGGANGLGVLFEFVTASNTYSKIVDFTAAGGSLPEGSLIQAGNGKLYGLTSAGGTNSVGTLFEFDPASNTYTKLYDFSSINGQTPRGSLKQAANGKLYGLTQSGGANGLGVLFEYDITGNIYTKKLDLNVASGNSPLYTQLIEVCRVPATPGLISSSFNSMCQGNPGIQTFGVPAVSGATAYAWTFPAGVNVISGATTNLVNVDFSGVAGGVHGVSVTASNLCGSSQASVKSVTILAAPSISVNSGAICNGQSFTLVPSGAVSYTYSSGSPVVSPTTNASYSVSGTGSNGCVSLVSAVSNVTVNALPVISVNSGAICLGQSFTLNPSGASTYTYSGGSAIVSPTLSSSYSVSGTSAEGCVSASPAVSNVTVNALPVISVNSGSICFGQSFTLVPSGASTYTFSGGSSVVSPTVSSSYSVSGTDLNGCVSANPAVSSITVHSLPVISVNSGAICSGNAFTMVPSGASTYTFSSGSAVVSPTLSSSYSVSGTSSLGCVSAAPAISNVTVNSLPVISVNSGAICFGNSFTMVPSGAVSYTYSSGSAVVSPSITSSYSVSGSSAEGCVSANPAIATVTVNSLPLISVNSGSICVGFSFTMNPGGAVTYTYSGGSQVVSPTVTTTYSVSGTDANGCVSASPALSTVTVIPRPVITVNSGTICLNGIFTMTPSGAASYTFSSGSSTVSPPTNTAYLVSGTSSLGCVSASPAVSNVTVHPLPFITVNSGTTCAGVTFTLVANGASTYTYSSGSNLVSPTVTSSYSVTGTSSLGCLSSNTAVTTITAVPLPFITVNSGSICNTSSFTLVPSGASTYTFSSGSAVVSPSVTTSYSVTGTSSVGCLSSNTAVTTITVHPRPFITVNSGSICATKNFTMNPSGAATYTYSSGSNVVTPLTSTFYTVIGTSSLGCLSINTATSTVTVAPSPVISVNSGSICSGKVFTMVPTGAVTYTFFNGSNTVSPVSNSSYSVTGTSSLGCVSPTPAVSNVTVVPLPSVLISGTNALCIGSSATLQATGAQSYSWSTGVTGATVAVSPTVLTTYSVLGLAVTGCTNITALAINALPLPTVTAVNGAICPGNSYILSPSGALNYTYSSGSATVFPVSTTTYSILGSDANGCVSANAAVVTVSVVNTLTVTVSGNTVVCEGENANLIANGASTYTWNTGAVSNTISVTPSLTTSYTVIGASGSCSDTSDVTVNVNPLPTLVVLSSDSIICLNESVEISASGANTYSWNTAQNGAAIVVSPTVTTTYTVTGTDANNCSNSAVFTQSVSDCVALEQQIMQEQEIRIYPNPNQGEFRIETASGGELSIYNVLGELILRTDLTAGVHAVELQEQAKGLYVIHLKIHGRTCTQRIIKQ